MSTSSWRSLSGKVPVSSSPMLGSRRSSSYRPFDESLSSRRSISFADDNYVPSSSSSLSSLNYPSSSSSSSSSLSSKNSYVSSVPPQFRSSVSKLEPEPKQKPQMMGELNNYNIHLHLTVDSDQYKLMLEPNNTYCGIVPSPSEDCGCSNNTCNLVKNECHDDSYLNLLSTQKVAKFLYENCNVHLLVVHDGDNWILKGEGLKESSSKLQKNKKKPSVAEYSFVAEYFSHEGEALPDGVYPIFRTLPCHSEFCTISVKACSLFIEAEVNEAMMMKKKTIESLEKKYHSLTKMLEDFDDSSCNSCEKAAVYYKHLHKIHNQLEAHMKIMRHFNKHCDSY